MLESVFAAALGATVTAAAGSMLVSSDRLRQSASLDASLLDALEKDPEHEKVAGVVKESMIRAAAVAAIRSTRPVVTLSEAVALAIALVGAPVYVALLATFPGALAVAMGALVLLTLTSFYCVVTWHWFRRAVGRIDVYRKAGLADDADEAERQADLAIAAQGVAASFSLMVSCLMMGERLSSGDTSDIVLALGAVAVAVCATYGARMLAKRPKQQV